MDTVYIYSDSEETVVMADGLSYTKDHAKCDPCKELWVDVLLQAVDDLKFEAHHPYNSVYWFLSGNDDIGSFLWICQLMNVDKRKILGRLSPQIYNLIKN